MQKDAHKRFVFTFAPAFFICVHTKFAYNFHRMSSRPHYDIPSIHVLFIFVLFIQYFKRVALLAKLASLPSGPL